jgi:hypothetical protein
LHPRPRRRTLTYHDVHPGDRGWVGLRFKDLVRVQSFFGVPPRNVTAESKHHDVVAVAADGAEAAFQVLVDPEIGRPVESLATVAQRQHTLDREHPDVGAEVTMADERRTAKLMHHPLGQEERDQYYFQTDGQKWT